MVNKTSIDINVNNDKAAFTKQIAGKICMAIIEFLLINKNQIPLPVVSFQQMINSVNKEKHNENGEIKKPNLVGKYKAERKHNKAIDTYNMYSQISEVSIFQKLKLNY